MIYVDHADMNDKSHSGSRSSERRSYSNSYSSISYSLIKSRIIYKRQISTTDNRICSSSRSSGRTGYAGKLQVVYDRSLGL
jgi:hypothetical protein